MFRIEVWFLHIAIELNREVAPHTNHTLCNLLLLRRREQHLPVQIAVEIGAPLQKDVKLMLQLLRHLAGRLSIKRCIPLALRTTRMGTKALQVSPTRAAGVTA